MIFGKKLVSLICLSSMMLSFDSSSSLSIKRINKDIDINKQIAVKQDSNKENTKNNIKIEKYKQEELERQRKLNVTYSRNDMTLKSGITEEELKNVLMHYNGASTMAHLSDALVDAEKTYGVNAFTMAAIVALESGFATSRRAVEDNNLTGYEVYNDDSEGRLFSSQYESVIQTAKHLSINYLREDGPYYRGLSVDDVQVSYCPDEGKGKNWDYKVDKLASDFLKEYKQIYKINS